MLADILEQRGATHGNFVDNARVAQALKLVFRTNALMPLTTLHKEALDLIALKISRVLTGNPDNPDNWDDIAGYATRVADEVRLTWSN